MRRRRLRVRRHWRQLLLAGQAGAKHRDLTLSSPRSFLAWACHHWSVTPEQLQRVQWQWTGTFAAGAQLVRMRPRLAYSDARDALAAGGRGGGVAGHFQERLWRAIFLSSLGGQCEPAAAHNGGRASSRRQRHRLRHGGARRQDPAPAGEAEAAGRGANMTWVRRRWPSARSTRSARRRRARARQSSFHVVNKKMSRIPMTNFAWFAPTSTSPMRSMSAGRAAAVDELPRRGPVRARVGTAQDCYDRCALNFVLGGECRAFTFLTDANAKGIRCWLKRPTYERRQAISKPRNAERRRGNARRPLVPIVPPPPQLLPATAKRGRSRSSAVRVSDLLEKVLPPLGPIRVQVPQARCTSLHVPGGRTSPRARTAGVRSSTSSAALRRRRAARWSAPSHSRRSRPSLPRRGRAPPRGAPAPLWKWRRGALPDAQHHAHPPPRPRRRRLPRPDHRRRRRPPRSVRRGAAARVEPSPAARRHPAARHRGERPVPTLRAARRVPPPAANGGTAATGGRTAMGGREPAVAYTAGGRPAARRAHERAAPVRSRRRPERRRRREPRRALVRRCALRPRPALPDRTERGSSAHLRAGRWRLPSLRQARCVDGVHRSEDQAGAGGVRLLRRRSALGPQRPRASRSIASVVVGSSSAAWRCRHGCGSDQRPDQKRREPRKAAGRRPPARPRASDRERRRRTSVSGWAARPRWRRRRHVHKRSRR